MKRILLCMCLALAACGDGSEPTAPDVEEAYQNVYDGYRAKIVAEFGSMDEAPAGAKALVAGEVQNVEVTTCEKSQTDLGFVCIFNFDYVSVHNGELIAAVTDQQARFYKGDAGWLVDES